MADFTAMMVVLDFTLSMIESVVLMVSVGLMLDPLTHVAHAFTEGHGSSAERLHHALTSIGISVLSGALTTAASCAFLFFTTIVLFYSFGHIDNHNYAVNGCECSKGVFGEVFVTRGV